MYKQLYLFENSVAFFLALALADNVFKEIKTLKNILAIQFLNSGRTTWTLKYKANMLKMPIYRIINTNSVTEAPFTAGSFQCVLYGISSRAEYLMNLSLHNIRRIIPNKINSHTTDTQRNQFMRQIINIFRNKY